jgi:hypothetical protein
MIDQLVCFACIHDLARLNMYKQLYRLSFVLRPIEKEKLEIQLLFFYKSTYLRYVPTKSTLHRQFLQKALRVKIRFTWQIPGEKTSCDAFLYVETCVEKKSNRRDVCLERSASHPM